MDHYISWEGKEGVYPVCAWCALFIIPNQKYLLPLLGGEERKKESRGGEIREERRWKWVERKGGEKVEDDCIGRRVVQWKIARLFACCAKYFCDCHQTIPNWTRKLWSWWSCLFLPEVKWPWWQLISYWECICGPWFANLEKGSRHYRNTISLTSKLIAAAWATGNIKVEPFPSVADSSTWVSHDTQTEPPQATQKRLEQSPCWLSSL